MRLLPLIFVLALGCKTTEECPEPEPSVDEVIEEPTEETIVTDDECPEGEECEKKDETPVEPVAE